MSCVLANTTTVEFKLVSPYRNLSKILNISNSYKMKYILLIKLTRYEYYKENGRHHKTDMTYNDVSILFRSNDKNFFGKEKEAKVIFKESTIIDLLTQKDILKMM